MVSVATTSQEGFISIERIMATTTTNAMHRGEDDCYQSHSCIAKGNPVCHNQTCPSPILTEGSNRLACSRCFLVHYCSKACQKMDWATHRTKCQDYKTTCSIWKVVTAHNKPCPLIQRLGCHSHPKRPIIPVIKKITDALWETLAHFYPETARSKSNLMTLRIISGRYPGNCTLCVIVNGEHKLIGFGAGTSIDAYMAMVRYEDFVCPNPGTHFEGEIRFVPLQSNAFQKMPHGTRVMPLILQGDSSGCHCGFHHVSFLAIAADNDNNMYHLDVASDTWTLAPHTSHILNRAYGGTD